MTHTTDMLQALIEAPHTLMPLPNGRQCTAAEWFADYAGDLKYAGDILDVLRSLDRGSSSLVLKLQASALLARIAREWGDHAGPALDAAEAERKACEDPERARARWNETVVGAR